MNFVDHELELRARMRALERVLAHLRDNDGDPADAGIEGVRHELDLCARWLGLLHAKPAVTPTIRQPRAHRAGSKPVSPASGRRAVA